MLGFVRLSKHHFSPAQLLPFFRSCRGDVSIDFCAEPCDFERRSASLPPLSQAKEPQWRLVVLMRLEGGKARGGRRCHGHQREI